MYSEARKLAIIKKILKADNDTIWEASEDILNEAPVNVKENVSIYDFVGILSKREANLMNDSVEKANSIS